MVQDRRERGGERVCEMERELKKVESHLQFMSSITVALMGSVTLLFEARQVRIDMKSERFTDLKVNSLRTNPCGPVVKLVSIGVAPTYQ